MRIQTQKFLTFYPRPRITNRGCDCLYFEHDGKGYKLWESLTDGNPETRRDAAYVSQYIAWRHSRLAPRPYSKSRFISLGRHNQLVYGYVTQIAKHVDSIDRGEPKWGSSFGYWDADSEDYQSGPVLENLITNMLDVFHRRVCRDATDIRPGNIGICGRRAVVIDFGQHTLNYPSVTAQVAALRRNHRESWNQLIGE